MKEERKTSTQHTTLQIVVGCVITLFFIFCMYMRGGMMMYLFCEKEIIENETKQVFLQGVNAGIHYMMDKIERQYKKGKPIQANGSLYWLKDAKENLRDIMDDMEAEYNKKYGK